MEPINKKTLEHKLHIQHKNDKSDVIDIINKYFVEIQRENDKLLEDFSTPTVWENGVPVQVGTFNSYGYLNCKKYPDVNEIARRIRNMKQRKPKEKE